jgi:excisionase family DNA binding protein
MTVSGIQMLSVADVGGYVGKCDRTIHRWIRRGRLKASRGGGQWLIHPRDLHRFLGLDAGDDAPTRVTPAGDEAP